MCLRWLRLASTTTQALDFDDDLTIPPMDDTRRITTEDEDPDDQIVNDANVLAEVRLSSTIRMLGPLSLSFLN